MMIRRAFVLTLLPLLAAACTARSAPPDTTTAGPAAAGPAAAQPPQPAGETVTTASPSGGIAPGAEDAAARLAASPRHGEWIMVRDGADSVRAWLVYPERSTPAPVVIVVHEIFGVSDWIRGVVDQLAADGFIGVAPDFLTGHNVDQGNRDSVVAAIRRLDPAQVQRRIDAVARHLAAFPSARRQYAVMGFCWGGTVAFNHAVHAPQLGASVVYYGSSAPVERLGSVRAPILGLYGEDDARVNATIAPADSALRALGRSFEYEMYAGAGHGFLRQQTGRDGSNLAASRAAWPRTITFLRRHLEQ